MTAFGAVNAEAQTGLPPEKGGRIYSLGMPPVYKGDAAATLGWHDPGSDGRLNALFSMGVHRDLGSPVVGLAALGLEGYVGFRGREADGGGRALFMIPALHITRPSCSDSTPRSGSSWSSTSVAPATSRAFSPNSFSSMENT